MYTMAQYLKDSVSMESQLYTQPRVRYTTNTPGPDSGLRSDADRSSKPFRSILSRIGLFRKAAASLT